jgi:desulfoferrodoxin (superoxide reductase-like protein)
LTKTKQKHTPLKKLNKQTNQIYTGIQKKVGGIPIPNQITNIIRPLWILVLEQMFDYIQQKNDI